METSDYLAAHAAITAWMDDCPVVARNLGQKWQDKMRRAVCSTLAHNLLKHLGSQGIVLTADSPPERGTCPRCGGDTLDAGIARLHVATQRIKCS